MVAGPEDLWETFDYVLYDADYNIDDDVTVYKYMDSWTNQPGYPLITVTPTNDGFFKASQVMKTIKIQNSIHCIIVVTCPRGGGGGTLI